MGQLRTLAGAATVATSAGALTNALGDQFVRISTNPGHGFGGIGPGDSGAPALVDGGPTIAAVGSHGPSPSGSGTAYFTRLDTPAARAFVEPFLGMAPWEDRSEPRRAETRLSGKPVLPTTRASAPDKRG